MYLPDVQLHEAASLDDAASFLSQYAPEAKLLAGGTDVLVDLKTGRYSTGHLITLSGIKELRGIESDPHFLRIGAMTSVGQLIRSPRLDGDFQVLREAALHMAATQVRNTATVGGNIGGGVPCADLPPLLLVMNASLEIWSTRGVRTVALEEFFIGPRETNLREGEILVSVIVPRPQVRFGASYQRFSLREGNAIAVASVAAGVQLDDAGTVVTADLALGAVAPIPTRVEAIGDLLAGRPLDDESLHDASEAAMSAADPITDIRGTAAFRRELVGILARRALLEAGQRAERKQA
jgi:carbon-monoxide dehydrogenase medium subunit